MLFQWLAGITAALVISPKAWEGTASRTHMHVWAAIFLGGAISSFPIFMALTRPGTRLTRHAIAIGQMLSCGLFIHLTGGRIESHFQYFGSLAFLAFYRDWRVLATASLVAGLDHFLRGIFWPQSIFGVLAASPWRWLEHVGWVVFEDVFLLLAIRQSLDQVMGLAARQAELEAMNEVVERKVEDRTRELRDEIAVRARAEESLRLLQSAVEQSKESILITEADLNLPGPKIVFVNPAFTQLTGYSAAEALGKTPRILQGPRTNRAVLDRLRKNLAAGGVFSGETINYRKDGTEFELEWQIAPIRNGQGVVTHYVAIQRDITERKRFESQLLRSQKMETVGQLVGGIAHEFNSILTAIMGQCELIQLDLPADSSSAHGAREINQAAGRAAALTRQLLAYGRKQMLRPEPIDLNNILLNMRGVLNLIMGPEISPLLVCAPDLPLVMADSGQVEQVIMNMLINARDAMPNGGKLTLETAPVSFDEDSVGRNPELKPGHYVMLAITDTGTGMSDHVKAHLFEPFFTTKGVGEGTGLGLSTCYGIVKQTGGHISAYSESGRGTAFKVYLPQAPSARPDASRQTAAQGALPGGTETILLVEDDPALRDMEESLLKRLGYKVWTAGNGVEALNLKQRSEVGHIDLLFTDVVMPHMSGKELADRFRSLNPRTKILFTSAYTERAGIQQGFMDENTSLLQKPFTPSALARKLRETLDHHP